MPKPGHLLRNTATGHASKQHPEAASSKADLLKILHFYPPFGGESFTSGKHLFKKTFPGEVLERSGRDSGEVWGGSDAPG